MFHVYGGKYLSRKAVHNWVEKRGKLFADDEEVEKEVRTRKRQQSNDSYAAGFDSLVKRWDKCINVGGKYVEK
jgi:major membrane immunogen (membrane-anchored lipoprotein)